MSACRCKVCGCPVDCGEVVCPRCEFTHPNELNQCSDGHCDIRLEEIKPNVYKFRRDDGTFYLKRESLTDSCSI